MNVLLRKVGVTLLLLLALPSFAWRAQGAARETGFLKREVAAGGARRHFRVYVPADFDPRRKYPVVLYLHGSYHWGEDNEGQLTHGLPAMMRPGARAEARLDAQTMSSFIGVFPQTRPEHPWSGEMAEYAVAALDQTVREFKADPRRLYVTGFSLGGYGSWYVAARSPRKFAAVAPVGGNVKIPARFPRAFLERFIPPDMLALYDADDPHAAFVKSVGKTPFWIFHGEVDEQIPVADARGAAAALKAAGVEARYTEYKGAGHFIHERVYAEPGFWEWLLSKRLSS